MIHSYKTTTRKDLYLSLFGEKQFPTVARGKKIRGILSFSVLRDSWEKKYFRRSGAIVPCGKGANPRSLNLLINPRDGQIYGPFSNGRTCSSTTTFFLSFSFSLSLSNPPSTNPSHQRMYSFFLDSKGARFLPRTPPDASVWVYLLAYMYIELQLAIVYWSRQNGG